MFQTLWSKVPGIVAEEDQLFVGDIKLGDNPRMKIYSVNDDGDGDGGTFVTINPTITADSGQYTCMIADNRLDQRLVFTLQVLSNHQEDYMSKSGAGRSWLGGYTALHIIMAAFIIHM